MTNAPGPKVGNFVDLTPDDWEKGYHSLWMSAIQSIQAALPHMKKQKWGRIILSTSTSFRQPIPELTISNSYHPGLLGVMKTVALEVAGDGITVNAIMPASIHTRRMDDFKLPLNELAAQVPAGRLGKPEEFASLALFLGSEQAAFITGQAIACNGGTIKGI